VNAAIPDSQQVAAKPRVYVETTIVSYLKARFSRDLIVAAHQQVTRDWWDTRREQFELVTSQLVVREAAVGDTAAAQERLEVLGELTLLATTPEALALAQQLVQADAVPTQFPEDALHMPLPL
jgi:hypothetical protein